MFTRKQLHYLFYVFRIDEEPDFDDAIQAFEDYKTGKKNPRKNENPDDSLEYAYLPDQSDYAVAYMMMLEAWQWRRWKRFKQWLVVRMSRIRFFRCREKCEQCKKPVGFRSYRAPVYDDGPIETFCSKECYDRWIPF